MAAYGELSMATVSWSDHDPGVICAANPGFRRRAATGTEVIGADLGGFQEASTPAR